MICSIMLNSNSYWIARWWNMTTRGDDLLKGNPWMCLLVSYPATPNYMSVCILWTPRVSGPFWDSMGSSSPSYGPICLPTIGSVYICPAASRYSKPGQYTVTKPISSCFLVDVNFSLIPKSLLLPISFKWFFFSYFILIGAQRRIHWGKVEGRK